MKLYKFTNYRYNNILLFIFIFIILFIGRDTLVSSTLLGFNKSQLLTLLITFIMILIFIFNNIKNITEIIKDKRIVFLIIVSIFFFILIILKHDYQLMYFSILFAIYLAVFLTFIMDFKIFSKYFLYAIVFLSLYSLICTYILKYFSQTYLLQTPIFKNSAGTEFYNFLFSFVVSKENYFRNFSIFREPGVYQFFIIIALFLNNYFVSFKKQYLKTIFNFILVITMLTTFSTNGFIELLLLFIYIFFDKKLYKNKKSIFSILAIGIILIFLILIIIEEKNYIYWTLYSQFRKLLSMNASLAPRIYSLIENMKIFIFHPLLGDTMKNVMYSVNHNTSSTLILFASLGIFGGLLNMSGWLLFLYNKKKNIFLNIILILMFFMSFNTQNLTTNIFFWILPTYGIVNILMKYKKADEFYENTLDY